MSCIFLFLSKISHIGLPTNEVTPSLFVLLPDARGRGLLCFCATDAGVPSEGTVQTQHGRTWPLHLPV